MLSNNLIPNTWDYGAVGSAYAINGVRCIPTREQAEAGLNPLSTIYSQHWNALWACTNEALHCAQYAAGMLIDEINTVLCCANISPDNVSTDQLFEALQCIKTTLGDGSCVGSVKSSPNPGQVSINSNGIMTANCVGNSTLLTTTCTELTGAINELKDRFDTAYGDLWDRHDDLATGKAPNNHACCDSTYGVGSATNYGHLRISDERTCDLGNAGTAASQKGVYDIYYQVTQMAALGNIVGRSLADSAAVGTCITAARSDHVHPAPTQWPAALRLRFGTAPDTNYTTPSICQSNICCWNTYSSALTCFANRRWLNEVAYCYRYTSCALLCCMIQSALSYARGSSPNGWTCACAYTFDLPTCKASCTTAYWWAEYCSRCGASYDCCWEFRCRTPVMPLPSAMAICCKTCTCAYRPAYLCCLHFQGCNTGYNCNYSLVRVHYIYTNLPLIHGSGNYYQIPYGVQGSGGY